MSGSAPAPALAALADTVAERNPISLDQVLSAAALQTRVDRKFLLTPEQFRAFAGHLGNVLHVMEIDGQRIFRYASTYFDSHDFEQYRAHRQGRRKRFKVRSRTYVDTGLSMFEVKTKGLRGETVKHRMKQPVNAAQHLNAEADAFLADVLAQEYGQQVPDLQPVLDSSYRRATFVDPIAGERVTADVELFYTDGQTRIHGPEMIVVETKTSNGRGVCDLALAELGLREVSMSKYCLGVAMLNPQFPANRWSRLLRDHFTGAMSR